MIKLLWVTLSNPT